MMAVVGVSPAVAAGNNSNQTGLVNVSLGDVALLNNVNLAVAANLAATVCGVTVPVAVLAQQVVAGSGAFTCNTTSGTSVCHSGSERGARRWRGWEQLSSDRARERQYR